MLLTKYVIRPAIEREIPEIVVAVAAVAIAVQLHRA